MIHFEQVSYQYNEAGAGGVQNLNLHIRRGECVLLTGTSGSSKTTLTRMINGLIPHFYEGRLCGRVLVDGLDTQQITPADLATKVGSVFQNPRSQFFNIDTTSEIAFGCENLAMSREQIWQRVQATARELGIERLLHRNIFDLSGGEKQMVALASVYALSPEIFVLDEPSSNLDAQATHELRGLLQRLKELGKTIVIAEHRLYYLVDLADRIIYLKDGQIAAEWQSLDELSEAERIQYGLRAPRLARIAPPPSAPPVTETTPMVQVQNLQVSYRRNTPVLNGLTFDAKPGEVIALIGTNGQGKSTFARTMCGLLKETAGAIRIHSVPVPAARRMSLAYLVMQDPNYQLFTESVAQELLLARDPRQRPSPERVNHILRALSLEQVRERHPMSLSGGQKQRTAIAVAMMLHTPLLIFDEPTSGLDYHNMQRVAKLIEQLRQQGKTMFIITHDYEFLLATCQRVLEFQSGRIIRDYRISTESIAHLQQFFMYPTVTPEGVSHYVHD